MSDTASRFEPIPTTPPRGLGETTPRYRLSRAVHPSANDRHRHEPPFSQIMEADCWQYAICDHMAGEIIETRDFWPHPTFVATNCAARMVLQFFNSAVKSRLPCSPWS